jgi:DNA polymerase-1
MGETRQHLFLVDAMGFLFRAYFAPMERLQSPAGMPTKVPYVFANMVRRLVRLKDLRPDYLGVVFDAPGKTFRDALFAEYKAQRPPMPDDLGIQLPYVRRMCEAMRLPILEFAGYEADDVIGALARQGAEAGLEVVIVTSDKDMLQLVGQPAAAGGRIRVFIPTKGDLLVDEKKVEELMGVPPEKVPDVMALMGDSIDNIPGARGIGEKGARELILRFGSAESAVERAAEVEGKRYREALQNSRDAVLMSKKLATIATDAPVSLDLDALRLQEPDTAALRRLYAELGFTSLLRELAPAPTPADEALDYAALDSPAALREFLAGIPAQQEVAIWPVLAPGERESEGYGSRVVALEISPRAGVARTAWFDQAGKMRAALADWLARGANPLIVHDAKLFCLLMEHSAAVSAGSSRADVAPGFSPAQATAALKGGATYRIRHATRLCSYLLRPTTAKHDLGEVVLRQLNVTLGDTPGQRADYLQRLAPVLREEVDARGLRELYERVDLPLAPVLARMERHGVRVDPKALEEMSATMEEEVRARERKIWELAGYEFNVNSPQRLAEVLFDKLNLPMPRKYGRGKVRSTAAEVLEELALVHELPRQVIEYREVAKLKSTYVDALPRLIHPETGRLHTSFDQTGTATGRLSSSDPNLQNIPVRTELGRKIRAAFVAEPGWTLLSADYSQIELRILAHFSGDPVLVEAFRKGEDIHARTAQEVFGVGPLMQTAEHRRVAKVINFGIIYGLSPFGLAQQLGIDQKEAAKFITAYFERYRGVKEYLDAQVAEVRKTAVARTLHGRMRPIPEINSPQANARNFAIRTALNTPFQGTAADLIKLAMIEIDGQLAAHSLRTKMILQVHDELLFEVPQEELDAARGLVKPAMEQVYALKVPLVVDLKAGPNWRDMG